MSAHPAGEERENSLGKSRENDSLILGGRELRMAAAPKQQGKLPFEYLIRPSSDDVTSYGGLPLVVDAMRALGVCDSIRKHIKVRKHASQHDEVAVLESLVAMLAAGGDCFDDLKMLSADKALCRLLERNIPSPETARKFLYAFHDDNLLLDAMKALPEGETAYIPAESAPLAGLGQVQTDFVRAVAARGKCRRATIDLDATIQESHKKEAKFHFDNGRGYQPTVAVWVEQDLVVADEFRDGNVPAAKGTLAVTKKAFAALPENIEERFFRGDSACYNTEQMVWLESQNIGFSISADMHPSLKKTCKSVVESSWRLMETRATEQLHVCESIHFPANWPKGTRFPRFLLLRLTPTQGKLFEEEAGPKYLAVATNREGTVEEILRWHWQKAGTIEHVHDVVKNELGGGVLPCGR